MKVVIQQTKCKGYINLVPIVKGKVIHSMIYSVLPYNYCIIGDIAETMKKLVRRNLING
ncbi:hypothetical protein vBPmiSPMCJR_021 [Proteus phage vB_PmiS_PM-CJR]|nr:hypothetical protein vBPmiSPMCJR_021 [Proteus phage vB_PmiS_PM-CJR]